MTTTDPQISERARTLHFNTLVIDALEAAPMTPEHFARLRRGGIHAVNYTTANITHDFAAATLDLVKLLKTIEPPKIFDLSSLEIFNCFTVFTARTSEIGTGGESLPKTTWSAPTVSMAH